ncbi:MAG: YARHG domain-containing protein [Ignavibacteriae bacterium]|nr:YARHG domain-containing protein [Ignavibacteriota bacterium]
MRIIISLILCLLLMSCSKKDEQLKKIGQDLKDQEKKLEQEKKDLENISKQKEEELKKAKEEFDKVVDANDTGKYPGKYPFASTRELTLDDLKGISDFDLKIMRNEILARLGYIFQDEDMKFYFSGQKWYKPKSNNVDKMLSDVQKANIQTLDIIEKRNKKK